MPRRRTARQEPRCYSRIDDEVSLATGRVSDALEELVEDIVFPQPYSPWGATLWNIDADKVPDESVRGWLRYEIRKLFLQQACLSNGCDQGAQIHEEIKAARREQHEAVEQRLVEHLRQCEWGFRRAGDAMFSPAFVRRLAALIAEDEDEDEDEQEGWLHHMASHPHPTTSQDP